MKRLVTCVIFVLLPICVIANDYSSSILSFLRGYRSEVQGKYDDAIEHYKSALRFDPKSSDIRSELSFSYIRKGEIDKAEPILQEAVKFNENNRSALILLGSIYSAKGEFDKAKTMYWKCIVLNE